MATFTSPPFSNTQVNNKLVKYTQDINREFCRENTFSPYMGEEMTSVIRVRNELKSGGDTMNLPLVTRLQTGIIGSTSTVISGSQTLVGSEEVIEQYGMRVKVDWARNAVVQTKAQAQMDSADIFGEAKPLLSDWGRELQRDEIIQALMALPTDPITAPADVRVNGILYQSATTGNRDTWNSDNSDRVLYGSKLANYNATHATALKNVLTTDTFTGKNLSLLKRVAMIANPRIRPIRTRNGYEYFVCFAGQKAFRDLKNDLNYTATSGGGPNLLSRSREDTGPYGAPDNPLFQDGDQLYDGVIVRQVPEISLFAANVWTTLTTAGAGGTTAGTGSAPVEPVFFCGQQAAALCWGQMIRPTFRKEDDYGFINGVGVEGCWGVAKIAKKHPSSGTKMVQFGMATAFFSTGAD